MGSQTALGYPYPTGTDRVMDGDNAIQALAEAVNGKVGAAATGVVSVPISALNANASAAVTFPVGRFTAAPVVIANPQSNSATTTVASAVAATASGVTVWAARLAGTVAALNVHWVAIQIP